MYKQLKIIYWSTCCLEPEIEAVSKEVFSLAEYFPKSFIFSVNPNLFFKCSIKKRYLGFHPSFYPLLRLIIPIIEKWSDLGHVYGEISPWVYHKALGRKPFVLTIASEKGDLIESFINRASQVIVQTTGMKKRLLNVISDANKAILSYPGLELRYYTPAELSKHSTIKILFATAPRADYELKRRGVYFLIELAEKNPGIHFTFLYRKWAKGYTSYDKTIKIIRKKRISNITLTNRVVKNMPEIYQQHDFTIIPYTTPDGGKECPNSLIESLACGIPVLISNVSPFSGFVKKNQCGKVYELDNTSFQKAVHQGQCDWELLRKNAVDVSHQYFNLKKKIDNLKSLYLKALGSLI